MNSSTKPTKLDIYTFNCYARPHYKELVLTFCCYNGGNRKHKNLTLPALPHLSHISISSEEELLQGQLAHLLTKGGVKS